MSWFGSSSSSGESILPSAFQDDSAFSAICPDLTYKQRIIGYISCFAFGYIISTIGTCTLVAGFSQTNIETFAILYAVGNIISLVGTGFLVGPKAQCKKMWDPTRRFSTALYLSLIIIVFALGVSQQNIFLILGMLVLQILAGIWYSVSFIPFGRKILLTILRAVGICYPCFYTYDSIEECRKNNSKSESSFNLFGSSK